MKSIKELKSMVKQSPFNKGYYSVNVQLKSLLTGVMFYIQDGYDEVKGESFPVDETKWKTEDLFHYGIPGFQRDNNKWSTSMQVKFVENCLLGHITEILLYNTKEINDAVGLSRMWVLDGQQRLTALLMFLDGELKVFGGYTVTTLREGFEPILRGNSIKVKAYTFADEREAIDFYIAMNEGITHSPEDITKAREYRSGL